ncbi:MAG: hypothetical protein IJQ22_01430 [Bacteroidales bacterium]|nr:hypothetical protein [Bacteroidales bacterium]
MKSIFKYILIPLLPLLLWTGCKKESMPSPEVIPDHCIELTLSGLHPALSVKGSMRGDDAYNENLVESVDCFFYPEGKTDEPAVFTALGRGASAVAEGDSTVYKVRVFFTDTDARDMFGSTVSGTCQVFVICNAPLSYGSDTSVDALKEMVVENDFTAQTIQGSFVMSAEETAGVRLVTDGEGTRTASGRIKVTRACAKIQFYLAIPETFLDEENHTWEPVLSAGVGITMSNAVKKGKVYGDYTVQAADYVNYGTRKVDSLEVSARIPGREDYKYTHIPFYSYPSAWTDLSDYGASVVFRIAWKRTESTDYTWKKYQLSPNISTMEFKRNNCYRTFVAVHSLGGADKEEKVIIPESEYEILPWMNESASGGGQGIVPGQLITYKYLVIDHPEQVINNEPKVYFTYVSSSPIASVKINTIKYYVNANANPETTQNVNRTITADSQDVSTNAGVITVDKSNPGYVTFAHSLDNMYSALTIYATITNEDGCTQDVVAEQNPSISLYRKAKSGDVFVNGYFARVADSPFGTRFSQGGNYYYRDPNSTYNNSNAVTMPNPSREYGTTIYAGATSGSLSTYYTTEVRISSFNTSNNTYTYTYGGSEHTEVYRIGDPRKTTEEVYSSSWSLYPYLYYNNTDQGATEAWQEPLKILTTSQNAEDQNIVAPKFLVSSSLNAMLTSGLPTFDQAVSRAAVYQETGYPAGRWRIPTEAEMAFIVARQQDGTIPDLYVSGSDYWSGSGRLMNISSSGTKITMKNGNGDKQSVRFVYDLWYWGDDASTTNVYHPNGHLYNYDSAGNATLIR